MHAAAPPPAYCALASNMPRQARVSWSGSALAVPRICRSRSFERACERIANPDVYRGRRSKARLLLCEIELWLTPAVQCGSKTGSRRITSQRKPCLASVEWRVNHGRNLAGSSAAACRRPGPSSLCVTLHGELVETLRHYPSHPKAQRCCRRHFAGRLRSYLGASDGLRLSQGPCHCLDDRNCAQPGVGRAPAHIRWIGGSRRRRRRCECRE